MGFAMTTFQVRPPAFEPVGLAAAKAHLRVDGGDEDAVITGLVAAARAHVEAVTRRALAVQGWRCVLGAIPRDERVRLRPGPVGSVTAVAVFDADGVEVAVLEGGWRLDPAEPDVVVLSRLPAAPNGIEIDFDTGFATAEAVPAPLKQAILMLVAYWFDNREAAALGAVAGPAALAFEALVAPFRELRL